MAECTLPLWLVRQRFAGNTCLWEALLHPDCAILAGHSESAAALVHRLETTFARLSEAELAPRLMVTSPRLEKRTITIAPPPHVAHWSQPVSIHLHVVWWEHPGGTWIAYVPALRQYVLRARSADLVAALDAEILRALERRQWSHRLDHLTRLALVEEVTLEPCTLTIDRPSPLQRMKRDRQQDEARDSDLRECITARPPHRLPRALGRDREAERLSRLLTGRFSRPVLLVGPNGVGKTALLHEALARTTTLPGPFWETDGLRLVAGMSGFGMWQERCRKVVTQARRAMAILHLGNLAELAQAGLSTANEQGIGEWFAGAIPQEGLLAVAECTAEQYSALERRFPRLVQVFERFDVAPPDDKTLHAILARETPTPWTDEVLREVLSLHARFATESAAPGRPRRFVRNLHSDLPDRVITESDVIAAFSRETGIPRLLLDDTVPLVPEKLHADLARQVIGQPDAIAATVDLITRIKARLHRPEKPLATLLFTGPTGGGKTELARALARFLFSDEQRMVRIDMSEYAHPAQAMRLFGGSGERDGVLTARIRENPFALVLLDEFEKAHPAVFDLLLQVCGEGRLTDEAGRLADFRNAVIVLTTNLGAAAFLQPATGFSSPSGGDAAPTNAADHFVGEARRFLRPEMFNRLDAIVPFRPLTPDLAREILARELTLLDHRPGLSERGLQLRFSAAASDHLRDIGFDPRYGARPLKRALNQHVLAPLAGMLNARPALSHRTVAVAIDSVTGFTLTPAAPAAPASDPTSSPQLATATRNRRELGALFRNHAFCDLILEHQRQARRVEKLNHRLDHSAAAITSRQQFTALDTLIRQARELRQAAQTTEDSLLAAMLERATTPDIDSPESPDSSVLARKVHELLQALESREDTACDQATWLAFCDDNLHLRKVLVPQLLAAASTLFRDMTPATFRVLKLRPRTIPDDPKFRSLRRQPEPLACLKAGFFESVEIELDPTGRERALDEALDGDWSGVGFRIQARFAWRLLRHGGANFEIVVDGQRQRGLLAALSGHPTLDRSGLDASSPEWARATLPAWTFDRAAGTFRIGQARTRESGRELGAWIAAAISSHYQRLLWSWTC